MTTTVTPSVREELCSKMMETAKEFLAALNMFSQQEFNKIPFAGSWTPAQVAEHVFKSVSGIPAVLSGKVEDTSRDPGEKVPELEAIFLDFSTKLKSPDFILPSDKKHDKEEMMNSLQQSFDGIIAVAKTADLSKTCLEFEFPRSGHLTRLELVSFAHVHTKRHAHQLRKIRGSI